MVMVASPVISNDVRVLQPLARPVELKGDDGRHEHADAAQKQRRLRSAQLVGRLLVLRVLGGRHNAQCSCGKDPVRHAPIIAKVPRGTREVTADLCRDPGVPHLDHLPAEANRAP